MSKTRGTVSAEDFDEEKIIVTLIATGMTTEIKKIENKFIEKPLIRNDLEIVVPPFLSGAYKRVTNNKNK